MDPWVVLGVIVGIAFIGIVTMSWQIVVFCAIAVVVAAFVASL